MATCCCVSIWLFWCHKKDVAVFVAQERLTNGVLDWDFHLRTTTGGKVLPFFFLSSEEERFGESKMGINR